MCLMKVRQFLFLILTLSFCCNTTEIILSRNVLIWKFAVWRNRVFLAVPRWVEEKNNESGYLPTLLEANWSEFSTNSQTSKMVEPFSISLNDKSIGHREKLRSVTALEVDVRGRLWVLDVSPKFDNPATLVSVDLVDVATANLRCLVVDPWGSKAYISDTDDESIVLFNLEQRRWWRINTIGVSNIPRLWSTQMAISRKNSILYLTGESTLELFGISLEEFKNEVPENVTVLRLGNKMGLSSDVFCDSKGGLHYFILSQKASVRWNSKFSLKAENHAILVQNESVPCITDYTVDTQKNLWALVNAECPFGKKSALEDPTFAARTIKIVKYPFTL
ncbi:hypothetical protein KM043_011185 [Ampulex compressa]|nr:hypothetical protein KM043_011185 [Ampulex compressa]